MGVSTVLLATDGSEYARAATERAIDLAADRGATLYVVCVVDRRRFDEPALGTAELATVYAEDHAALCVREVAEMAAARGVRAEGDTRHGVPHEVILGYADEVDADVVVVGAHGDHDEHFAGVGRTVREQSDRAVRVVGAGGESG